MIYLVNFPFCNFHSIQRYFLTRKLDFTVLDPRTFLNPSDIVVLPGVGTFREGSTYLNQTGLFNSIKHHADSGGFLLGICLGMQLLLSSSDESPGVDGLNIFTGSCSLLPSTHSFRVPHIGWNSLIPIKPHQLISGHLADPKCSSDFYFVHSYYCKPTDSSSVIASFHHPSGDIPAIIAQSNTYGLQFHPEKSGNAGYKLLDNIFLS